MSNENESVAKIREMAQLSLLSNKINPIQEKNLKIFPRIFLEGVKSGIVDYDFNNKSAIDFEADNKNLEIKYKFDKADTSNFKVIYKLKMDNKIKNDSIEKRFAALESAVRGLFWKNTKVSVYFDDNLMFESKDE